jgi:hypothetical protein
MAVPVKNPVQEISASTTIPAPTGGLNARDNLMMMAPGDAIIFTNMIPAAYGSAVREGSMYHATGLDGSVQSILTWQSGLGSKMFASSYNGTTAKLYDVTTAGAVGAPIVTGLGNAQWRQVNFANSAGTHLVAVNGNDNLLWYHGVPTPTMDRILLGDGVASGTIKNVDPVKFIAITVHQKRLWFVEKNTMHAWYLPTDQVYGIAAQFDLGPIFKRGGYLVGVYTWTKENYDGPSDQIAYFTSEGEVAVYAGTDVSTEGKWGLVGVYFIGSPLGYDFGSSVSGDLLVMTEHGVISMNLASKADEGGGNYAQQASAKIQKMLNTFIKQSRDEFGWQIFQYPLEDLVLVNVPFTFDGQRQLAFNSVHPGWGLFNGWRALCWRLFRQDAFFGDPDGNVLQAFIGHRDGIDLDGTGGVPIPFEAQQAFNFLGVIGRSKYVSFVRPSFSAGSPFSVVVGVMLDYAVNPVFGNFIPADSDAALWDVDTWDHGRWGSGVAVEQEWVTVGGVGFAASVRIKGEATGELFWIATDWIYQAGGMV